MANNVCKITLSLYLLVASTSFADSNANEAFDKYVERGHRVVHFLGVAQREINAQISVLEGVVGDSPGTTLSALPPAKITAFNESISRAWTQVGLFSHTLGLMYGEGNELQVATSDLTSLIKSLQVKTGETGSIIEILGRLRTARFELVISTGKFVLKLSEKIAGLDVNARTLARMTEAHMLFNSLDGIYKANYGHLNNVEPGHGQRTVFGESFESAEALEAERRSAGALNEMIIYQKARGPLSLFLRMVPESALDRGGY